MNKWVRMSRFLSLLLIAAFICVIPTLMGMAQNAAGPSVSSATAAADSVPKTDLWKLLQYGGIVMACLGFVSVVLFVLIIYYLLTFRVNRIVSKPLLRKTYSLLSENNPSDAAKLCENAEGIIPRILLAGIKHAGQGRDVILTSMEAVGSREAEALRHRIAYLASIANIAPMLGLLGTITGMIKAFNRVVVDVNMVKPIGLASGISQALVTTAAGLIIGIIATIAYYYFRGKVHSIITLIEEISVEFVDKIVTVREYNVQERGAGGLR